jgi:hypothetical protein
MAAGGGDTVTANGESWNSSKNRKLSGKIKTPIEQERKNLWHRKVQLITTSVHSLALDTPHTSFHNN